MLLLLLSVNAPSIIVCIQYSTAHNLAARLYGRTPHIVVRAICKLFNFQPNLDMTLYSFFLYHFMWWNSLLLWTVCVCVCVKCMFAISMALLTSSTVRCSRSSATILLSRGVVDRNAQREFYTNTHTTTRVYHIRNGCSWIRVQLTKCIPSFPRKQYSFEYCFCRHLIYYATHSKILFTRFTYTFIVYTP